MIKRVLNLKVLTQHSTGSTYKLHVLMETMATLTHIYRITIISKRQVQEYNLYENCMFASLFKWKYPSLVHEQYCNSKLLSGLPSRKICLGKYVCISSSRLVGWVFFTNIFNWVTFTPNCNYFGTLLYETYSLYNLIQWFWISILTKLPKTSRLEIENYIDNTVLTLIKEKQERISLINE